MNLEQLLFAVSETKGMDLVAASFSGHDNDSWDGWNEKLRPHTRLLGGPGAVPGISFSHLSFPDGTAAVLRRFGRPGDVGRNVAHALVGDRATISRLVPAMTTRWGRWLDERPISNQLPAVAPEEFDLRTAPRGLEDPMLVPILMRAMLKPANTYSVVGVPDGLELSLVWALRTLLADREWTFSTYEENDATQPNLPRLVFLSGWPSQEVVAQEGRLRIDVHEEVRPHDFATKQAQELMGRLRNAAVVSSLPAVVPSGAVMSVAANDIEVAVDDTPTTMIPRLEVPEAPPPPSQVPWPDLPFHELVHGDAPLPQRLVRFAELAGQIDGEAWHGQIRAWIEDTANAPGPFAATLVQAQRARGYTGFDEVISRRWLAEQGIAPVHRGGVEAARSVARPPVDESVARAMWGKHEAWTRMADHYKERALTFRLSVLGTLAGSALLTVLAAQFNSRWLPVTSIGVALLTAALVVAGIYFRAVKEPAERARWTNARMIAEQVKAEVCKYLAGAAPYRDPKAVALLRENVERVERDEKMHEMAATTPVINDLRTYVDNRVRDQITYHRRTAERLQRNLQRMRMAEYLFQGMAAALAAVGAVQGYQLAVWAGLLTTIAGAVTAHIAQTGYDRLVVRYRRTVHDLEELVRMLPERPDPAAQDTFVTSCEQVISRQNDDWLSQLTTPGKPS